MERGEFYLNVMNLIYIQKNIQIFISEYWLITVLLIIAAMGSLPSGSAFMLLVIFPIFIPASIFYRRKRLPNGKKVELLIWFLFLCVVVLKHAYFHFENREVANHLVETVSQFKEKNGEFPKNLELIGLSTSEYRKKYRIIYGAIDKDTPLLFYPTEFSSFQSYMYFFADKQWRTVGG